eukprot:1163670-Prymnesium_polylepis.1
MRCERIEYACHIRVARAVLGSAKSGICEMRCERIRGLPEGAAGPVDSSLASSSRGGGWTGWTRLKGGVGSSFVEL